MLSNTQLLAIAKKQLGNGGAKYRKYVGASGNYCNMYVFWLYDANGCGSLFPLPNKNYYRTYCPDSIKWCRKNLAEIPPYLAMACDIIYFDWEPNGVPNHIGIVDHRISTAEIATVEGNTSGKIKGKTVSGIVAEKTRNTKYVCGIFRPHFPGSFKKVPLTIDGAFGYNSIAIMRKALGLPESAILDIATVKALQKRAGLKGKAIDGAWGKTTSKAVQRMTGLTGKAIDGEFGINSVKALQTWCNKIAFPVGTTKPTTPTTTKPTTTPSNDAVKPSNGVIGKCIDVSYWQAKISLDNWKKIRKSCEYAICRASFTDLKKFVLGQDSTFENNVKNARAAGFKAIGTYHFSQALSVAEAQKEANFLCDILDKYDIDFWVACDYETNRKGRLNGKTVSTKASEIANAFCAVVEKRGYKACIYANYTMLTKYLKAPKYPIWLAQYNSTKSYSKNVVLWQYTSKGRVDGITAKNTNNKSADVDLSYVYEVPTNPQKPVEQPVVTPVKPAEPTVTKPTGKYTGILIEHTIQKGYNKPSVGFLQRFLNWYGKYGLIIDNGCGDKTVDAMKAFQKAEGLEVDGVFGKKSFAKAKSYLNTTHKYEIVVNKALQICTVFDNGIPIISEFVSTARKGYSTPTGNFKIQGASGGRKAKLRTAKMSSGNTFAEYLDRFKNGKCMHCVPYKERNTEGKVNKTEFNKLGTVASAGCVRQPIVLAKFIYEECPVGTPVNVINDKNGGYPMGKPIKYKATSNIDPTYEG